LIPTAREAQVVEIARLLSRIVDRLLALLEPRPKPRVPRVTLVLTVHPEEEDPDSYRH
jgi:hypothetical protein